MWIGDHHCGLLQQLGGGGVGIAAVGSLQAKAAPNARGIRRAVFSHRRNVPETGPTHKTARRRALAPSRPGSRLAPCRSRPRRCLEHGCPEYAMPGRARCAKHDAQALKAGRPSPDHDRPVELAKRHCAAGANGARSASAPKPRAAPPAPSPGRPQRPRAATTTSTARGPLAQAVPPRHAAQAHAADLAATPSPDREATAGTAQGHRLSESVPTEHDAIRHRRRAN